MKSNSDNLLDIFPSIAKQWHPTMNLGLQPNLISAGSSKKVWWLCEKGHEYAATVSSRTKYHTGCPYCSGRLATKENCLANLEPGIAQDWHPTKNGELTPFDVTRASGKLVWWFCKKGHEYEMTVHARNRSGCPYCAGKRANSENCLATISPVISSQWHPTLNGQLTPYEVTRHSGKVAWWLCDKGHVYDMVIKEKKTTHCPYCIGKRVCKENCLETIKPQIANQWHPEKNSPLTPKDVTAFSNKKIWWICDRGHEFQAPPSNRYNPFSGCKKCNFGRHTSFPEQVILYYVRKVFSKVENRKTICIEGKLVEMDVYLAESRFAIEYDGYYHKKTRKKDIEKNELLSKLKVKLIRVREPNLPNVEDIQTQCFYLKDESNLSELEEVIHQILIYISNKEGIDFSIPEIDINRDVIEIYNNYLKVFAENNLAMKFPDLTQEWNYEKNLDLRPEFFSPFAHHKVWWVCLNGHEWKTAILNRTFNGNGCPYCARQFPSIETCLATVYPELIEKWDKEKNQDLHPTSVMPGSRKKVWWICHKGHSHQMSISKKVANPNSCPYCNGKKVNAENCLANVCPMLAEEWHDSMNDGLTPFDVTKGTHKRVWWRCSINQHHVWDVPIHKRTSGQGCPYCSGRRVDDTNSLEVLYTDLSKEWDYEKNGKLTPAVVTPKSTRKVWWICLHHPNHSWQATIASRTTSPNSRCPICNNRKATEENSLLSLYPEVTEEWDYEKNFNLHPSQVVPGSGKKVWWTCKQNQHSVFETIRQRVRRNRCRICPIG